MHTDTMEVHIAFLTCLLLVILAGFCWTKSAWQTLPTLHKMSSCLLLPDISSALDLVGTMQKELGKQTCTSANKLTSLNVHALKEGNNDKSGMNLSALRACIEMASYDYFYLLIVCICILSCSHVSSHCKTAGFAETLSFNVQAMVVV